ncbi:unnamed protein product, partial [Iphiclides podalirius]
MCSLKIFLTLIGLGYIQITEAAYLKCFKRTMGNVQTTPLEMPLPLMVNASCIDPALDTVVYINGFNGNVNTPDAIGIITAYLSLNTCNVLYLDWAEEASDGNLGMVLGYLRAVPNVKKVGNQLGASLLILADAGLDLDKLHLVGLSLGAQVSGVAGEIASRDGKPKIGRITGLDPAGPLFRGSILFKNKLTTDSGKFVDVLHTDPGGYGIHKPIGTVDVWINYHTLKVVQPGCPAISFSQIFCSHERSAAIFQESILNRASFLGSGQANYFAWIQNKGTTAQVEIIGEYISLSARGNYYLVTNAHSPYGKGRDGLAPNLKGFLG